MSALPSISSFIPLLALPDRLTLGRPSALWLLLILPFILLVAIRRGAPEGRARQQLLLRMATIALLALALAEPLMSSSSAATSTVFVIDRSLSIDGRSSQSVDDWILASLRSAAPNESISIINFGAAPQMAATSAQPDALGTEWTASDGIDRESTNIESALGMARALPGGSGKRIILISDGAENSGNLRNQADQAASEQTAINVLPLPGAGDDDLQVTGISAPSAVWNEEPLKVTGSVSSTVESSGTLEFLIDGEVKDSRKTAFPAGLSSYTFDARDLSPGFHSVAVRVTPDTPDRYAENNVATSSVQVRDAPLVLIVTPPGSDASLIADSLARSGVRVEVRTPTELPSRTSDLALFDAFVLINLPADQLSIDQMAAFKEVTSTMGRGLIVVGGTAAYGRGGYAGTVLEEALPVTVKVTEGKERQKVALLLIVDKSGSMSTDQLTGVAKIDLAKEAVKLAGSVLIEGDEFGLIAFSDQPNWVLPIAAVESPADREAINAAVETIKADGSTNIYSALEAGFASIANSDASVKHVVLLSDGKSSSGTRESYQKLIEEARGNHVTFSAIAIGEDADIDLLQFLADKGSGNYSYADSPEKIPQLTLAEAQSAGSQSVLRDQFGVVQEVPSPMLSGIDSADLPIIDGYNFAEVKPNAQAILTSDRSDPLLVKWQLGLGRVVAWTADDGVDFARAWPGWPGYDVFWKGILLWSLPDPENSAVQLGVERSAGGTQLVLSTIGSPDDYVAFGGSVAVITDAAGAKVGEAPLFQSAPGEYRVRLPFSPPGAYSVTVQPAGESVTTLFEGSFTVPLSAELRTAPGASDLLADVASITNGATLSFDDPAGVFDTPASPSTAIPNYRGLWWLPLSLALIIFLVELGLRYRVMARFTR